MSQILLIALLATLPAAALTWICAWAVEVMGAGLRLRLRAWTVALLLPVAMAATMLAVRALDVRSVLADLREPPAATVAMVAEPPAASVPIQATPTAAPAVPIAAILLIIVAAGAAFRLAGLAMGLRWVALMAARSEDITDPALALRLGRDVRQADNATPILAGLLRPTILMPRRLIATLSVDQAVLVCAHERAHLAAGDHLSHLMEETLVRLFWFNPFLAAVRDRLAAAREEACDARALAGCDDTRRRAYAQSLIAALRLAGRAEPVAALTGFRRRGVQQRLHAILKPAGSGSALAVVTAAVAGIGLTAALGGASLALAAEPQAPPVDAAAPLQPGPPAPPAPGAPPAPPAPPGHHEHHHTVVIVRQDGDSKDPGEEHTMVFDDEGLHGGHFDPDKIPGLNPQQREKLKADMEKAHAAMAQAMADSHQAMIEAHHQMALSAQDQAHIHQEVEEAMRTAHAALAQNDGRVLMRCKLGADGKATDCEKLFSRPERIMMFERSGPPMPPMPGMPPEPPLPPPPPPPPAG